MQEPNLAAPTLGRQANQANALALAVCKPNEIQNLEKEQHPLKFQFLLDGMYYNTTLVSCTVIKEYSLL